MGKPRKTSNPLFDIVWAEWPPRITNKGVWEKRKKGPARKKFELINPTEEEAYDMVAWIRKDKECRKKAEASNSFFTPPADLVVFLNSESWEDEIGIGVTPTDRRESKRNSSVYSNNVKSLISQCEGIIKEWPIQKLLGNSVIRAGRQYPEFRAWALEQRPDLKGARPDKADKADNPPSPPPVKPKKADQSLSSPAIIHVKTKTSPVIEPKKEVIIELERRQKPTPNPTPDTVQDLPPPSKKDKLVIMFNEVKQAKADGTIEKIVNNTKFI